MWWKRSEKDSRAFFLFSNEKMSPYAHVHLRWDSACWRYEAGLHGLLGDTIRGERNSRADAEDAASMALIVKLNDLISPLAELRDEVSECFDEYERSAGEIAVIEEAPAFSVNDGITKGDGGAQ